MLISQILRQSTLASDLGDARLARLVDIARVEEFPANTAIFEEGDDLLNLYVIAEGSVALTVKGYLWATSSALRSVVTTVEPGGTFGWSAIVEPNVATLSADTRGSCTLVALNGQELIRVLDDDPVIGYKVMRSLLKLVAYRLETTRRSLLNERGLATGIRA